MKKTTKITGLIAALTLFAAVSASAQTKTIPSKEPPKEPPKMEKQGGKRFEESKAIIGQVKKMNTGSHKLTVTDLDGNEVSVTLTPFTRIEILQDGPKTDEPPAMNTEADISAGDWVMITTFNTETKTAAASSVMIKKAEKKSSTNDNSSAK